MFTEMCRVITTVYPTNMEVNCSNNNGTDSWTIPADNVQGCDDYEEFRETILGIIEERVGFELDEHERAWVGLDIQIWSDYFPDLKKGRSKNGNS